MSLFTGANSLCQTYQGIIIKSERHCPVKRKSELLDSNGTTGLDRFRVKVNCDTETDTSADNGE
jgi:hypothetical protein